MLLVVDQMRADQLLAPPRAFTAGYRRLLEGGAVFLDCRYRQGPNETAPGHAVLATGAWAHRNGIEANTWWSYPAHRAVYAVEDRNGRVVGAADTAGRGCGPDTAQPAGPGNLVAETLSDRLWAASRGRARTVAIAGKDRPAVLMAGVHGKAYWADECTGGLVTSTYYHATEADLPDWLRRFNRDQAPARWWGQAWPAGDSAGFRHALGGRSPRDARFATDFFSSPLSVDWTLAAAESAVAGLGLGRAETPDLLCVGLSAHDAVGHEFGPESPEAAYEARCEDLALGGFLDFLDARVGRGRWLLALSADHGVGRLPEDTAGWRADPEMREPLRPHARPGDTPMFQDPARAARFAPPGRLLAGVFLKAADSLAAALGASAGHWRWWDPYLYFATDSAAPPVRLAEALLVRLRAELTNRFPMARMFVRSELRDTAATRDPLLRAARLAFYEVRAGDFYVVPDPGFLFIAARTGTRHGAPYAYDNHVPLVFYGPGVRAARHAELVSPADVAPTLGARLGVGAPAQAEGRDLRP
ncbi:MAG TPA: alkaline phosphatase family protein [Candidatus Saccharimonadales bacterium]|nr:alkaline phosphatase family protein [Candidatus Saccharimonadales bacterium]